MIFILVFIAVLLFNLYTFIWGKKDLQALRGKLSIGRYLKELSDSIKAALGEDVLKWIKICVPIILILIILFNLIFFIECALAIVLGIYAAKRAYQYPATNSFINKIATYINRMR